MMHGVPRMYPCISMRALYSGAHVLYLGVSIFYQDYLYLMTIVGFSFSYRARHSLPSMMLSICFQRNFFITTALLNGIETGLSSKWML